MLLSHWAQNWDDNVVWTRANSHALVHLERSSSTRQCWVVCCLEHDIINATCFPGNLHLQTSWSYHFLADHPCYCLQSRHSVKFHLSSLENYKWPKCTYCNGVYCECTWVQINIISNVKDEKWGRCVWRGWGICTQAGYEPDVEMG